MPSRLTPSHAPVSTSASEKLQDKDETRARVEADPDLETVQEEEEVDGVFGAQGGKDTVNYRRVGWISTSVLLAKMQIGVGVLSIPSVFKVLGLVPGLLCLLIIAGMTTWPAFSIGWFKRNHPECYSIPDAVKLMSGKVVGEIFAVFFWIFIVFVAGLDFLTISTALNATSLHATCTAIFVAVAALTCIPLASIQRLDSLAPLTWIGIACLVVAVFVLMVAVAVGGRPALAPKDGPLVIEIHAFKKANFPDALTAISVLVTADAGVPAYMSIASEIRDFADFETSVVLCQGAVTAIYVVVGVVVYIYAGQYVASPALGTAGVLIKRIAYGIALPGLIVSPVLTLHLCAKFIFVRLLKGSYHLNHSTLKHWFVWLACTIGCGLFGYTVASAIPAFEGLLGLIGASFGTVVVSFGDPHVASRHPLPLPLRFHTLAHPHPPWHCPQRPRPPPRHLPPCRRDVRLGLVDSGRVQVERGEAVELCRQFGVGVGRRDGHLR